MTLCWCGLGDFSDPAHKHACIRPPGPREKPPVYEVRGEGKDWNLYLVGRRSEPAEAPPCHETGSSIELRQLDRNWWCFQASAGDWHEEGSSYSTRERAYTAARIALQRHAGNQS